MSAFTTTSRSVARLATRASNVRCFSSVLLRSGKVATTAATRSLGLNNVTTNKISKVNNMTSVRSYTVIDESAAPSIDYNIMKEIATSNDAKYVIVDVREPDEYSAGHIPHAINIPCKSSPGALGLDAEEFKLTFGFDKPSTEKTLVFYCLAGVRARMSEELAGTFGYEHRLTYLGSFKDWLENNGKIEIPAKEAPAEAKKEETKA